VTKNTWNLILESRLLQNKHVQNCRGATGDYTRGLKFIAGLIPKAVLNSQTFDLNVELFELHPISRLRILDITMMSI
jgi:hypothetical protein